MRSMLAPLTVRILDWQSTPMNAWRYISCWVLLGVTATGGCRSSVGSVYSVATGQTTAEDIMPAARAGAPPKVPEVTQTAFAPPPVAGVTQQAAVANPVSTASPPVASRPAVAVGQNPLPEPTREQAFAAILADLQQIGAENPAAQQVLLKQLEAAEPGNWQAIVRRFRSTLAYHDQLTTQPERLTHIASQADHTHDHAKGSGSRGAESPAAMMQAAAGTTALSQSLPAARMASVPQPYFPPQTPSDPAPAPQATPQWASPNKARPASALPARALPTTDPHTPTRMPPPQASVPHTPGAIRLASAESTIHPGSRQPRPMVVENPYGDVAMASDQRDAQPSYQPPSSQLPSSQPPTYQSPSIAMPHDWRQSLGEAIVALEATATSEPLSTTEAYEHARLRLLKLASGELDGAV
ncbi:MAG: hypothetical protein AAGF31_01595, partial [Planctomycetota bacterium]